MLPWVLIVGGTALVGCFVWAFDAPARARRAAQRELAARRNMSADELARIVAGTLRYENWGRFAAAGVFLDERRSWSDEQLRAALQQIFEEVCEEDTTRGRRGRDSNYFEFHDSGLAEIAAIVEARCAAPGGQHRRED